MLKKQLKKLVDNFEDVSIPEHGRYVKVPATADEFGVDYIPPAITSIPLNLAIGAATCLVLGFVLLKVLKKK